LGYLWRWGVEVNFRDEKNLAGTGDAQVRSASSNQHLPAVTVAAYALLWVAALGLLAAGGDIRTLDPPKWRGNRRADAKLLHLRQLLRSLGPDSAFKRGFSITLGPDGKALRSATGITPGTRLLTKLADGTVASVVE
jgi:hypothetical protein